MPIPRYKAPKLDLRGKRTVEIPFNRSIPAGGQDTLLSNMIGYPFRILQTKMTFDRNARNLVQFIWLLSTDTATSTVGIPSGDNVFSKYTTLGIFIGESIVKILNSAIDVDSRNMYIKLHVINGLGVAYNVSCSMIIQEL